MWINVDTLLLIFAVLFNCIELISPKELSLRQLFRWYREILPPYERFDSHETPMHANFQQIGQSHTVTPVRFFAFRKPYVYGYLVENEIKSLSSLVPNAGSFPVFNTENPEWHTVNEEDAKILGIGHNILLVQKRDQIAATHKAVSDSFADKTAHVLGIEDGHKAAANVEFTATKILEKHPEALESAIKAMEDAFKVAYEKQQYKHQKPTSSGVQ